MTHGLAPMARAMPFVAAAAMLAFGCGSKPSHESAAPALPPEAMRPSPVDREAPPPPVTFDWSRRIAVAGRDTRGHLCIASSDESIPAGTAVTFVWLAEPQTVSVGTIGEARARPWVIANTPVTGHPYDVEMTDGTAAADGFAIAVTGTVPAARVVQGLAHIDLDGDGEPETFRQCSSLEGLHLTVWSGEPLKGPQDWHAYVYLGMDLEATCTERDGGQ